MSPRKDDLRSLSYSPLTLPTHVHQELLGKQIAGAAAGVAFSAIGTALIVVVLRLVMKLRIPEEHERSGIDQHTHGRGGRVGLG